MNQSQLSRDPFEAHQAVMQRVQQLDDQRQEQRRKPLPEESQADVRILRPHGPEQMVAEVLDLSSSGMRLAAFVNDPIQAGERCGIAVAGTSLEVERFGTVRWVERHPLIQVFGVQFDRIAPA